MLAYVTIVNVGMKNLVIILVDVVETSPTRKEIVICLIWLLRYLEYNNIINSVKELWSKASLKFFHYHFPDCGSTKFGLEVHNDQNGETKLDAGLLRETAQKAAKAIGLDIYGGDCIVTPKGDIYIIDMNDFPSFTLVRDIAAREIATLIMNKTK